MIDKLRLPLIKYSKIIVTPETVNDDKYTQKITLFYKDLRDKEFDRIFIIRAEDDTLVVSNNDEFFFAITADRITVASDKEFFIYEELFKTMYSHFMERLSPPLEREAVSDKNLADEIFDALKFYGIKPMFSLESTSLKVYVDQLVEFSNNTLVNMGVTHYGVANQIKEHFPISETAEPLTKQRYFFVMTKNIVENIEKGNISIFENFDDLNLSKEKRFSRLASFNKNMRAIWKAAAAMGAEGVLFVTDSEKESFSLQIQLVDGKHRVFAKSALEGVFSKKDLETKAIKQLIKEVKAEFSTYAVDAKNRFTIQPIKTSFLIEGKTIMFKQTFKDHLHLDVNEHIETGLRHGIKTAPLSAKHFGQKGDQTMNTHEILTAIDKCGLTPSLCIEFLFESILIDQTVWLDKEALSQLKIGPYHQDAKYETIWSPGCPRDLMNRRHFFVLTKKIVTAIENGVLDISFNSLHNMGASLTEEHRNSKLSYFKKAILNVWEKAVESDVETMVLTTNLEKEASELQVYLLDDNSKVLMKGCIENLYAPSDLNRETIKTLKKEFIFFTTDAVNYFTVQKAREGYDRSSPTELGSETFSATTENNNQLAKESLDRLTSNISTKTITSMITNNALSQHKQVALVNCFYTWDGQCDEDVITQGILDRYAAMGAPLIGVKLVRKNLYNVVVLGIFESHEDCPKILFDFSVKPYTCADHISDNLFFHTEEINFLKTWLMENFYHTK